MQTHSKSQKESKDSREAVRGVYQLAASWLQRSDAHVEVVREWSGSSNQYGELGRRTLLEIFEDEKLFADLFDIAELSAIVKSGERDLERLKSLVDLKATKKPGIERKADRWKNARIEVFNKNRSLMIDALASAIAQYQAMTAPPKAAHSAQRTKRHSRPLDARAKAICDSIQRENVGLKHARYLHGKCIPTPDNWQSEGCPKSYTEAYSKPKWRENINKEKNNHQRRCPKCFSLVATRQSLVSDE